MQANEKEPPPLWDFVPTADYHLPAAPVTHSVRERLAVFRRFLRRGDTEQESPLKAQEKLQGLPQWQLERVSPAPEWHCAAEALEIKLEDWLRQEKLDQPVIVLVGPPHSGHTQILTAWAALKGWSILTPPSAEQILAGDDTWLSKPISAAGPWVFPALERAYLRHTEGLGLIRRFLDRVYAGDLGRGIMGCDSWAWAFLRHVWRGRLPVTLTLQACDKARLADHFQRLANPSIEQRFLFHQSDNGRTVLPPPETTAVSGEISNFLQLLAAHSRGIFGIAWAIWRASLQTEPDEKMADAQNTEARSMAHQTIWVIPWNHQVTLTLPSDAGRDEAFVLHTLLLHNGLSLELLQQLLPLSPSQVMGTLFRLDDYGLVVQDDAIWQVTPRGYPVVRRFLQAGSYLVDHF